MTSINRHTDPNVFKPEHLRDYLTTGELAAKVKKTRHWILRQERNGRLPKPIRVKNGRLMVRLYSPEDVALIQEIFDNAKPGRASDHYGVEPKYGRPK